MPIELVADISVKHYIVLANNLIFLNSLVGILRSAVIDPPFYRFLEKERGSMLRM